MVRGAYEDGSEGGGWCAFASKDDSQSESRKYRMLIRWLMEPWKKRYGQ